MYMIFPCSPCLLTWNPPSCVRIRPPLLPVAHKLTLFVPSVTHLFPFTQNPDPPGFPDLNIHQLGRHCELVQVIRHNIHLQELIIFFSIEQSEIQNKKSHSVTTIKYILFIGWIGRHWEDKLQECRYSICRQVFSETHLRSLAIFPKAGTSLRNV